MIKISYLPFAATFPVTGIFNIIFISIWYVEIREIDSGSFEKRFFRKSLVSKKNFEILNFFSEGGEQQTFKPQ